MKKILILFVVFLGLIQVKAQDTFSICAVELATGQVGSAGATCITNASISVNVISDVHPGVGVIPYGGRRTTDQRQQAVPVLFRRRDAECRHDGGEQVHRLGQGGGWYDRFLRTLRPDCVTIGVAFAPQIVDVLPVEPHDVQLDMVVTDAGPCDSHVDRPLPHR